MKSIQPILLQLAMVLALCCLSGALGSGIGPRFNLWEFIVSFNLLKWSVYLVGIPVVLAILAAIIAKMSGTSLMDYRYAIVLIIAVCTFGIPYTARLEFRKFPTLADATTSFDDPPVFVDLVTVRNEASSNPLEYRAGDAIGAQRKHFPNLVTLESKKSPAEIIKYAVIIAEERGLKITAAKPEEGRLEATETSFWFRFKDDIVVRARALGNGVTEVDIRSASRVGYLDGGINAKRVEHFIQGLSED